jgi:hypothetical protein
LVSAADHTEPEGRDWALKILLLLNNCLGFAHLGCVLLCKLLVAESLFGGLRLCGRVSATASQILVLWEEKGRTIVRMYRCFRKSYD